MEQTFTTGPDLQRQICSSIGRMDTNTGSMMKAATSPQQVHALQKVILSQERVKLMGQQPVTVVNINPYRLRVNGTLFERLDVPANRSGDKYSALVIASVEYQIDPGLDHNWTPEEYWPIQLANEFLVQYHERGGVFIIRGDLKKNPELELTDEFKSKYKLADDQLVNHCRKLKREADSQWNTPNRSGSRNIHPPHRVAAEILMQRKLIKQLPGWMNDEVAAEDVTDDCPGCSSATKKGQIMCACTYVLDPMKAFQKQLINEFHISLERLTRDQVQSLGISAYVAETSDERDRRRKPGKPKPLSVFDRNQQEAALRQQRAAEQRNATAKEAPAEEAPAKKGGKDKEAKGQG